MRRIKAAKNGKSKEGGHGTKEVVASKERPAGKEARREETQRKRKIGKNR